MILAPDPDPESDKKDSDSGIGSNLKWSCKNSTEWGGRLRKRFCNMFSDCSTGSWAELQLPCCPSKEGELPEKHVTEPFLQPAAPDCTSRVTHQVSDYILAVFFQSSFLLPTCHANSARFAAAKAELGRHLSYKIRVNKM